MKGELLAIAYDASGKRKDGSAFVAGAHKYG